MQEFMPIPGLARRLFGGAADPPDLRRSGAPLPPEEVRCPRCDSANTKFCYYNNYNLSQPRHFCKTCRRYWTKGGLLRNVPVGGGCRKPKRPAAAADVDKSVGVHRDAKNPRSGSTGGSTGSPTASAASASNTVGAAAAAHSSGGSTTATGVGPSAFPTDALPLPLPLPAPAPMFTDQAAAFASLFAPPPPLPAFSFSAQPKAEEDVAPAHTLTEQPSSASSTADHMAQFSVRSGGAAMASATAWPPAAVDAAGIFDLAGDSSLYCNLASWTDPDGTIYLL